MIVDISDRWFEQFFLYGAYPRYVPADRADRLFRRLQISDDAVSTLDLTVPPSDFYETLRG